MVVLCFEHKYEFITKFVSSTWTIRWPQPCTTDAKDPQRWEEQRLHQRQLCRCKRTFFTFDHFAVKSSSHWGQVKAIKQTKVSLSVFMETWCSASNSLCDGDVWRWSRWTMMHCRICSSGAGLAHTSMCKHPCSWEWVSTVSVAYLYVDRALESHGITSLLRVLWSQAQMISGKWFGNKMSALSSWSPSWWKTAEWASCWHLQKCQRIVAVWHERHLYCVSFWRASLEEVWPVLAHRHATGLRELPGDSEEQQSSGLLHAENLDFEEHPHQKGAVSARREKKTFLWPDTVHEAVQQHFLCAWHTGLSEGAEHRADNHTVPVHTVARHGGPGLCFPTPQLHPQVIEGQDRRYGPCCHSLQVRWCVSVSSCQILVIICVLQRWSGTDRHLHSAGQHAETNERPERHQHHGLP